MSQQKDTTYIAMLMAALLACGGGTGSSESDADAGPDQADGSIATNDASPECEAGFQDDNMDGVCNLSCEGTGANDALNCGDNGSCEIGESGERLCVCVPGFAGADCSAAFAPSETDLALWLDASSSVFALDATAVMAWVDIRGNISGILSQDTAASRPQLIEAGLNGKRVVRFDGTDDNLNFDGDFPGLKGDDYTIVVAAVPDSSLTFPQFIVRAVYLSKPDRGVGFGRLTSPIVRFLHNVDAEIAADVLDLSDFVDATEPKVFAVRRSNSATPTEIRFTASDDSVSDAKDLTLSPAAQPNVGTIVDGGDFIFSLGASSFDGDLAEVLVYDRALDDTELAHVRAYLTTKWGL